MPCMKNFPIVCVSGLTDGLDACAKVQAIKSPDLRGSQFDTDSRGVQARFADCEAVALTTLDVTSATALRFASVMELT